MESRTRFETTGRFGGRALLALALAGSATAQVTTRVSVDSGGVQGNDNSSYAVISADGRYVTFWSYAANLVPGDTNGIDDVFVRDLQTGATERVSVDSAGAEGDDTCNVGAISDDGRYVAFVSGATNLVPGDTNFAYDIFVRDRQTGLTERVSVSSGGAQGNDNSPSPISISADGRYVAFSSSASNLVPGDTNTVADVFVRDRQAGTTERVSVSSGGTQGNGHTFSPAMSPDGRYVAFLSQATNLVAGDTNALRDIFVRDRQLGLTERVSLGAGGVQGNGASEFPSISADGRYVAFRSAATNLVSGDTNGSLDMFVRDRQSGATERVSVSSAGAQATGTSAGYPSISADGRYVSFGSNATNLVTGDTNGAPDVFVRDRQLGLTERVSVDTAGTQGNGTSQPYPGSGAISADGRFVVYFSSATNLASGDTNGFDDVFLRDRVPPPMVSVCDPGSAGVVACPCSNPPGGAQRGCNNSANTGGASLATAGVPDVSTDTLVFTTSGQIPSTLSVLVQGTAVVSSGAVYGRGVRCAGGVLRTLYTKTASGGSITAPDSGSGDPTVSARSAAEGDPLAPGQTRWYFVGYRDPVALCPAEFTMPPRQTFNATQTWRVIWQP